MKNMLKVGIAAVAFAAIAPTFAEDVETESEYEAIGWTPFALGLASPVQIPWGSHTWDVFGMNLGVLWSDAPKMYGLGVNGIAMATRDDLIGVQISGLCNWATKDVVGFRATVGGNFTFGTTYGMEMGLFSYREGEFWGWDSEFLGAYQENVWGLGIGGICNLTMQQSYGAEIAGVCNYSKVAYGLQLAGVLNFTDELHGFQLGIVNYARECPWGLQIGLINMIMDNSIKILPLVNFYF